MDDRTVTGRVVAVLDVVASCREPVPLAELTRATGIPKPTVRRIANDLVRRQLLEHDGGGYRLGGRMLEYGVRASEQQGLRDLTTPHVNDLLARTHEIAWAGIVTDRGVTLVSCAFGTNRVEIARAFAPGFALGHPALPATAMGRVVLAERPDLAERLRRRPLPRLTRHTVTSWRRLDPEIAAARETGVAVEHEEGALGYSCAVASLRGHDGSLAGLIGVTGRTPRLPIGRLTGVLRAAAEDITAGLAAARRSLDRQDQDRQAPDRQTANPRTPDRGFPQARSPVPRVSAPPTPGRPKPGGPTAHRPAPDPRSPDPRTRDRSGPGT